VVIKMAAIFDWKETRQLDEPPVHGASAGLKG
jgi:hypothetical protein